MGGVNGVCSGEVKDLKLDEDDFLDRRVLAVPVFVEGFEVFVPIFSWRGDLRLFNGVCLIIGCLSDVDLLRVSVSLAISRCFRFVAQQWYSDLIFAQFCRHSK